jgi:hypothetical protein
MYEIYAAAFRVLIYIGGDDADSNIAMGMIAGAHDSRTAAIGNIKYAVPAIQKLFERPYFSRIWIIQEIAMARAAIVYCGADSLCWSKFHPSALKKIDAMVVSPTWIEHLDRPRYRGIEDFPQLLLDTSGCKSSDPRDKVFALLGLILGANQEGLLADYSLSAEQVYIGLAASLLINHPSCKILRYRNSNPLLPSWVPDWRTPPSTPNIQNIFQIAWFTEGEGDHITYLAAEASCRIHGGSGCLCYPKEVSLHLPTIQANIHGGMCFWPHLCNTLLRPHFQKLRGSTRALEP